MAAKLEKTKTPGIYRRGSKYVIRYRVNGQPQWESHRTYDEARRAKSARQADADRGEFAAQSKVTLHDYALEWVETYRGRGRRGFREDTRDDYRRQLHQYVLRYFPAKTKLTELSPRMVSGFVGWLCDPHEQAKVAHAIAAERAAEAGKRAPAPLAPDATRELADGTVRGIMAPLRACLGSAVRDGLIRSNPARDVDLPHRPRIEEDDDEDIRPLSREQLDVFLTVVSPRWRTFFVLLASSGLRISEAIALQWRHLELDGSRPHVKVRRRIVRGKDGPPKSKYGRRDVPLPHALVVALRELHATTEWPRTTDPVFPSATGTPMLPSNLFRRVLKPAGEEAGVPWIGFHTFRHTCASMLFAAGRNAVQVQRWLGHHSAAFTLQTYVHLLDGDLGDPLDVLGAHTAHTPATPRDPTPLSAEVGDSADLLVFPDVATLDGTAGGES